MQVGENIYEMEFWQKELECMPLNQLIELQNEKLKTSKVLERAFKSSLYEYRWKNLKIDIKSISNRNDLKKMPLLTGSHIKEALKGEINDFICSKYVRLWFSTSGTTGEPKWIPYSDDDILTLEETLKRTMVMWNADIKMKSSETFKGFFITTPAPFISGGMCYSILFFPLLLGVSLESMLISLNNLEIGLEIGMARKPNGLIIFPSLAMKIAEEIEARATSKAKEIYLNKKSLKNYLLYTFSKVIKVKPKYLFRSRISAHGGEPLDPYREGLKDSWGTKPYDLYATTEFPVLTPECKIHDGLHVWLDHCIVELIPKEELEKEEIDPNYIVKTIFLDEANVGMKGEIVITTFGGALPLIRYRISDNVEVKSVKKCGCGRTHPRVRFLQRIDDLVNLGIVRFSIYDVDEKMKEVSKFGVINKWQMHISRDGWKPNILILIEAVNIKNESKLMKEIHEKLVEIDILKGALDKKMILPLSIKFISKLEEKRTRSGKLRLVIYDRLEEEQI